MMQLLSATKDAREMVFTVWLDTTKLTSTDQPDPAWVVTYRFMANPPDIPPALTTAISGIVPAVSPWLDSCVTQVKALATAELARRTAVAESLTVGGF